MSTFFFPSTEEKRYLKDIKIIKGILNGEEIKKTLKEQYDQEFYLESIIPPFANSVLYVDEEGKLKGLDNNNLFQDVLTYYSEEYGEIEYYVLQMFSRCFPVGTAILLITDEKKSEVMKKHIEKLIEEEEKNSSEYEESDDFEDDDEEEEEEEESDPEEDLEEEKKEKQTSKEENQNGMIEDKQKNEEEKEIRGMEPVKKFKQEK